MAIVWIGASACLFVSRAISSAHVGEGHIQSSYFTPSRANCSVSKRSLLNLLYIRLRAGSLAPWRIPCLICVYSDIMPFHLKLVRTPLNVLLRGF